MAEWCCSGHYTSGQNFVSGLKGRRSRHIKIEFQAMDWTSIHLTHRLFLYTIICKLMSRRPTQERIRLRECFKTPPSVGIRKIMLSKTENEREDDMKAKTNVNNYIQMIKVIYERRDKAIRQSMETHVLPYWHIIETWSIKIDNLEAGCPDILIIKSLKSL